MTEATDATSTSEVRADACRACGVAPAPAWDTADGRVHLCPPCATMNGIGCG